MGFLSGVLHSSPFDQSTDAGALGCSGYRPGLSPDRRAFCRVFCGFRYPFSRQIGVLSGVPDTILGGRPTDGLFVWCLTFFAFRSVDRCGRSRVFRVPSWADARQKSALSGILRFSVSVQSTDWRSLGCTGYRPGRMPDR